MTPKRSASRIVIVCALLGPQNLSPGCGRGGKQQAAPRAQDAAEAAWTEGRALARWKELGPTAASWEKVVATIGDAERRPLALALLRGGNVACQPRETEVHCGIPDRRWDELDPAAGFDDPCLRRLLVPWALQQLGPGDAAALEPQLMAIVALGLPEEELQPAAFAVAPDDAMRLRLLAAVQAASAAAVARAGEEDADQDAILIASEDADTFDALAETLAAHLTTDAARLTARSTMQLEAVIDGLDPVAHRADHLAALADPKLRPDTRQAALARFRSDLGADVRAALVAAASAADCDLAATAAAALAERGEPDFQPARPTTRDPMAHVRALCRLQVAELADRDARWHAWFGPTVEVVNRSEDISEPFDSPRHWSRSTETVRSADVELPEELGDDDWGCKGLSCGHMGHPNELTLEFVPTGGTLRIKRLTWHHYDGDDC